MHEPTVSETPNRLPAWLRAAILFCTLATPASALAHAGHGEGMWAGFLHPLLGLDHLLAAIAVGIWAARAGGRALWAVPLAFVGAMAAGFALSVAAVAIPAPELMIAASMILLGALIALDVRLTVVPGMLLVALFAPFHAAAHAVEMPASSSLFAYLGGLLLATTLLHGAGIVAALALRDRALVLRLAAAPIALAGMWMMFAR
jgi:urease accessory protein